MAKLTKHDWMEIHSALDSKRLDVIGGRYSISDDERRGDLDWADDLNKILSKIGHDGEKMWKGKRS